MATSPRMKWPYPSEGADPWYDAFSGMVDAQDASTFALNEEKNIILSGGGMISWSLSTSLVTWASPIALNSSYTGLAESVPAGSVSVINDGDLGYVRFIPGPTAPLNLVLRVSSAVPAADLDRAFVIFRRVNGKIIFRNGGVLSDGESSAIIDDGPGGGAGGTVTAVTASAPLFSTGGTTPNIILAGTVGIGNGGTGLTSVPSNGQLPIGNGSGYALNTITAGAGISVTNGAGSITIAATGLTSTLTAAEAIVAGNLIAVNVGGQAIVADSTVAGRYPAIGVALSVVGPTVTFQSVGICTALAGLTPATTYYLSTSGTVASAPPMGAAVAQAAVQATQATGGLLLLSSPTIQLV